MLEGILLGISTAFMPENLIFVFIGCFAGTLIGMLPGLGPVSAIALMIPVTYGFDPASGLILMAGVYYGAVFGGSTSAILLNAPGVSGAVATAFDGYPLAQQGKAGKALAVAAYSSFIGGTIGSILLLLFVPILAKVSLSFQSADYFALMLFGLTAISAFSGEGQVLKAVIMTLLGLMLSTIGEDPSGIQRFTFDMPDLYDGLSFLLLSMATFALAEALMIILKKDKKLPDTKELSAADMAINKIGSLKLTKEEVRQSSPVVMRSSVLGFFVGVLPGAGATIASFLAYGMERNLASIKEKLKFGKGSISGLAAPESSNNAASTGSFVPLLTLGIPGSATTAVMLGALLSYGVQPGPRLYIDYPDVFWAVIVSMYLGNMILLVLNLPLIPYIAKILDIPQRYLVPIIVFLSLIGVYLVSFNSFDLVVMLIIGIIAVGIRIIDYPLAPLLLGFILGDMMEDNLRRALLISDGSISFMWDRPVTATIMLMILLSVSLPMIAAFRKKIKARG